MRHQTDGIGIAVTSGGGVGIELDVTTGASIKSMAAKLIPLIAILLKVNQIVGVA